MTPPISSRPQPQPQDTVRIGNLNLVGVENYKVYSGRNDKKPTTIIFGDRGQYEFKYRPCTLMQPATIAYSQHPKNISKSLKFENFYDSQFTVNHRSNTPTQITYVDCRDTETNLRDNNTSERCHYIGGQGKHHLLLDFCDSFTKEQKK